METSISKKYCFSCQKELCENCCKNNNKDKYCQDCFDITHSENAEICEEKSRCKCRSTISIKKSRGFNIQKHDVETEEFDASSGSHPSRKLIDSDPIREIVTTVKENSQNKSKDSISKRNSWSILEWVSTFAILVLLTVVLFKTHNIQNTSKSIETTTTTVLSKLDNRVGVLEKEIKMLLGKHSSGMREIGGEINTIKENKRKINLHVKEMQGEIIIVNGEITEIKERIKSSKTNTLKFRSTAKSKIIFLEKKVKIISQKLDKIIELVK